LEKKCKKSPSWGFSHSDRWPKSGQHKSKSKQAKRLAGERKASQREGPQRPKFHDLTRIPGGTFEPGRPSALSWRREVNSMLKLFVSIQNRLADLRDEEGQTMAEYGVVLAVITLIIVATLLLLSGAINTALSKVITALK
jgi:Flp pilus assembly pilin Flp